MFKRYECGCVGFVLNGDAIDPDDERIWLVRACDDPNAPEYCFTYTLTRSSTLARKSSESLPEYEVKTILSAISGLVADGYRFRKLKALLSD